MQHLEHAHLERAAAVAYVPGRVGVLAKQQPVLLHARGAGLWRLAEFEDEAARCQRQQVCSDVSEIGRLHDKPAKDVASRARAARRLSYRRRHMDPCMGPQL